MAKRNSANLHKEDVVESTTSRPLHTVGTTLEADAVKHTKKLLKFTTQTQTVTYTTCPLSYSIVDSRDYSMLLDKLAA